MPKPGDHISQYRIISSIGRGGMGEVFLAEDKRLGRKVALKILLESAATDSETRRRFGQEARSASALNHPNIITIYEIGHSDGCDFIATEFVEGHNIRSLIAAESIQLNEALTIAAQVASALAAAHAAGIIHRDIKPENIIRRPDGLVKVLDFGLAKQSAEAIASVRLDSGSSAFAPILTSPGMVMGTLPYMSPEQARGKPVDARSDIWSLGVVLYEMLASYQPFQGETKSDLLAAILTREPEPLFIRTPQCSLELEDIVAKALAKDCDLRYQSAKDLEIDLKTLQSELQGNEVKTERMPRPTAGEPAAVTGGRRAITGASIKASASSSRRTWPVALILAAALGAAVYFYAFYNRAVSNIGSPSLQTSQITSWKVVAGEPIGIRPRVSPDGKQIAFSALNEGRSTIWVKHITGGEPTPVRQSDLSDTSPIWSPDGQQLACVSKRDGGFDIWAFQPTGTDAQRLASVDGGPEIDLLHWSKDGERIYFEREHNLHSLSLSSGAIAKLTSFDESKILDRRFAISADEKQIVYADRADGQSDIFLASLDGGGATRLTNDPHNDDRPIWHPDGKRVIYNSKRGGTKQIFAVSTAAGADLPTQILLSDGDQTLADISSDGRTVLYTSSKDDADLWAFDLDSGKETQLTSDIGAEYWPDAAPGGRAIAYQAMRRTNIGSAVLNSRIFYQQLDGNARPVELAADGFSPRWSPDGSYLAFMRLEGGVSGIWITPASGGDPRRLTQGRVAFGEFSLLPLTRNQSREYDWTPDNRYIIYSAMRDGLYNVWRVDTGTNQREEQLTSNTERGAVFLGPVVSPGGESIAWTVLRPGGAPKWEIQVLSDGVVEKRYQSNEPIRLLGWSHAGASLLVITAESSAQLSSTPTRARLIEVAARGAVFSDGRTINQFDSVYFLNVVLSPDRKSVAYVSQTNGSDAVFVAPVAGGSARQLLESNERNVYISNLAFSPDEKTVFYGKQASWQVIASINNFK